MVHFKPVRFDSTTKFNWKIVQLQNDFCLTINSVLGPYSIPKLFEHQRMNRIFVSFWSFDLTNFDLN